MPTRSLIHLFICVVLLATGSLVRAQETPRPIPVYQEPPPPSTGRATKPIVPLKVQVVLSRYDGDKKIESLPFTLTVNANERPGAQLNMKTQVPVSNTMFSANGPVTAPVTSFSYKSIGTDISCEASTTDDGRFSVRVVIEDSSVLPAGAGAQGANVPSFQSFNSSNMLVLKDGQTLQYAAATDAVSGRVTKVDVTVTTIH
jgi:hypothetical protein